MQRLELATSNLAARSWGLPRPIITRKRKGGRGPGLGELPEIWGFPFNIYIMAEASNFKFDTQLGFTKAHHKITPKGKCGHGLGLGELPKIFWFHFNIYTIYTMARDRDFKFGTQLGFAKSYHKTTSRGKVGVAFGKGNSHIFGVLL